MKQRTLLVTVILTATLSLSACLGPKPVVESYKAEPPPSGSQEPYRVEAVVSNKGPGDGQVEVEVDLKNKQNGEVIISDSKNVELKIEETRHVLFELNLPPSAQNLDPESIEVEVDAHYPH